MNDTRDSPGADLAGRVARLGLMAGPLAALALYAALPSFAAGMPPPARATAALALLMAVFWMTEAVPLPVTSLLPVLLFPLAGVFPPGEGRPSAIRQAAAPYANEFIFLYLGGFLIALGMEKWNLHRRIALVTVLAIGTSPARLVAGFMAATAFLSLWISNTACAAMMLPIGTSVTALVGERLAREGDEAQTREDRARFAASVLLAIAYSASIGGLGTLIGTPPNTFLAGYLKSTFSIELSFARWLAVGVPFVGVFLVIAWLLLTRVLFRVRLREIPGGRELIRAELARLGRLSRGEVTVLSVFLLTAALWILRAPLAGWEAFVRLVPFWPRVHDATIGLGGGVLLFLVPVDWRRGAFALDWETAKRLPWGVLLLFGGGLSLAAAFEASGLARVISDAFPADLSPAALILLTTVVIVFLTELTSNIATTSVFVPILGSIALGVGADPLAVTLPATIAASCAFMLPVATPPNAIVFGSGELRIAQMVKAGWWMNVVSIALVPLFSVVAVWYFRH